MKDLYNIIKEQFIFDKLEKIDCEIITESIQASIIKELANQLLSQRNKEKKEKENDRWRTIYNKTFKNIFGGSNVPWDKITDDDIQVIPAENWENPKTKSANQKLIRSIIKGNQEGIVIGQDPTTKVFKFVVFTYGYVYYLSPGYGRSAGENAENYRNRLNQSDKIDLFSNNTLYFIDIKNFRIAIDKLKQDRYQSKQGMINFDPDSLRRIASDNIERYKKIIAQNKANNINNDKLLDEAHELIKRVSEITILVAKDPGGYADIISKVAALTKFIYDERRYVSGRTPRQPGYYTGVNGLIPMITKYVDNIRDSKLGYSWGSKGIDDCVKALQDTITKCKTKLQEIEDLL